MATRTTVTLEEDVLRRAKEYSKTRDIPFRDALNALVRFGLDFTEKPPAPTPFKVKPFHMGLNPDFNYDCIGELLETLEGPEYK